MTSKTPSKITYYIEDERECFMIKKGLLTYRFSRDLTRNDMYGLKVLASYFKIKGYSKMSREKLIECIEEQMN